MTMAAGRAGGGRGFAYGFFVSELEWIDVGFGRVFLGAVRFSFL